jgi:hypothetical protein
MSRRAGFHEARLEPEQDAPPEPEQDGFPAQGVLRESAWEQDGFPAQGVLPE